MIKTELFIEIGALNSILKYQKFIRENKNIEVISVNLLKHDDVLLTYKA